MRASLLLGFAAILAAAPPALIEAARKADAAAVRNLLQAKADANASEPDGTTALHWAAYRDDLQSADLLLRAGAKVDAVTDLGVTPLWNAAVNGGSAMVKRLLAAGAKPDVALLSGETPLMAAARTGSAEIVELLAAKGANLNARATRGQTALMWAASQKHPEVTKVLLAHRADLKLKSDVWTQVMAVPPHGYLPYNMTVPHGGETALMFAARMGDLDSAKLLVAAGANVNDTDAWGVSATSLAAHSGFTELVEFLLSKDANPNTAGPGFTALHISIMRRDERMLTALLEHGADPNTTLKTWTPSRRSSEDWNFDPMLLGASPLWLAARFTQPRVMRLLVAKGADPLFVHRADYVASEGFGHVPRKENTTALLAALGIGGGAAWVPLAAAEREAAALETVKLAVDWGVDLNATSVNGRTALDAARALRYNSVVEYLTAKGAKAGTAPAGRAGKQR